MTVHHLVLFAFKPECAQAAITGIFEELMQLKQLIPGITGCSWGPNNSPEGLNAGCTHGFVMTFESESARDAYLPHPEHERVKERLVPMLAKAVVLDFSA